MTLEEITTNYVSYCVICNKFLVYDLDDDRYYDDFTDDIINHFECNDCFGKDEEEEEGVKEI